MDYIDPIYQIYPEYKDAPYASSELVNEITKLAKANRIVMTSNHEVKQIMDKFSRKPIVEFASAYFVGNIQIAGVSVIQNGEYHRFKLLSGGKELYNIIHERLKEQDNPTFPYANDELAEFVAENRKKTPSFAQKLAHYAQYHYVKFERSEDPYYEGKATIYTDKSGTICAVFYYEAPVNNQTHNLGKWLLKAKAHNSNGEMVSVHVDDNDAYKLYQELGERNHALWCQKKQEEQNSKKR